MRKNIKNENKEELTVKMKDGKRKWKPCHSSSWLPTAAARVRV
jgi:hypothetical protein